jgi:hypothetical protein
VEAMKEAKMMMMKVVVLVPDLAQVLALEMKKNR